MRGVIHALAHCALAFRETSHVSIELSAVNGQLSSRASSLTVPRSRGSIANPILAVKPLGFRISGSQELAAMSLFIPFFHTL